MLCYDLILIVRVLVFPSFCFLFLITELLYRSQFVSCSERFFQKTKKSFSTFLLQILENRETI